MLLMQVVCAVLHKIVLRVGDLNVGFLSASIQMTGWFASVSTFAALNLPDATTCDQNITDLALKIACNMLI